MVLIAGAEGVLADRAVAVVLAAARAADPELTVARLDASSYEPGRLNLVASPSLFGGGSLILVDSLEATSDAFAADLTAYLRAPAEEACLVLRHGGGVRGKALLDAVRATGAPEVDCAPLTKDEDKVAFVNEEVRRGGRRIAPAARRQQGAVLQEVRR